MAKSQTAEEVVQNAVEFNISDLLSYERNGVQITFDLLKYSQKDGDGANNTRLCQYRSEFRQGETVLLMTDSWWANQKLKRVSIPVDSIWVPLVWDEKKGLFHTLILIEAQKVAYLCRVDRHHRDKLMYKSFADQSKTNKCIEVGGSHCLAFPIPACRIFPRAGVSLGGKPNHRELVQCALRGIGGVNEGGFENISGSSMNIAKQARNWSRRESVSVPGKQDGTERVISKGTQHVLVYLERF
jgi:hypothetical protein